ncbi:LCP family protein [Erysipelotrichaceae bacterium 51-3]
MEKKKKNRFLVYLLGFLTFIFLSLAGTASTFWYLSQQGRKKLVETTQPEMSGDIQREGQYIRYQGKEYKYKDSMINILVSGIDKNGTIDETVQGIQGLADTIVLVSIDTENNQLYLTAVPRDTMTEIRQTDTNGDFVQTTQDKLSLQYGYGANAAESNELMVKAVSNILGSLPIGRYCSLSMDAVPIINDTLGGVDVVPTEDVIANGIIWFYAGRPYHLTGEDALKYVQRRDIFEQGSAMHRLDRQKQYLLALYNQGISQIKNDLTLPLSLYNAISPYLSTNLSLDEITYLASELANVNFNPENFTEIPGEAVFDENYKDGRTVFNVDYDSLQNWLIQTFYEEAPSDTSQQSISTENK